MRFSGPRDRPHAKPVRGRVLVRPRSGCSPNTGRDLQGRRLGDPVRPFLNYCAKHIDVSDGTIEHCPGDIS